MLNYIISGQKGIYSKSSKAYAEGVDGRGGGG